MSKERISITDLEKMMQTNYIGTHRIKLVDGALGDDKAHILEFDVFDGFAYCADYKGKEYFMTFPQEAFIKMVKEMEDDIRDYLTLDKDVKLGPIHMLSTYNTLHVNA